jgi:general secretion pathway protein C
MNHNQTMLARLAAFIVWALVAACAVYWSLKLLVRAPAAPAYSTAIAGTAAARGDLTRLLGAAPVASAATVAAAPAVASRFKLHGVMAPKGSPTATVASLQGVALISVDGKAPRAYAVGARVDSNLVLQSVSLRSAAIGPADGAALVKIDVPALPAPATGKLAAGLVAPVPPFPGAPQDLSAPKAVLPVDVPAPAATAATEPSPSRPPHLVAPRQPSANSR